LITPLGLELINLKPKPILEYYTQAPGSQKIANQSQAFDDRYLQVEAFLQSKQFKPNTQKLYKRKLQRWINWTDQPWASTTEETITRYLNDLQRNQTAQNSSNASLVSTLTALKSFFNWMAKTRQIEVTPAIAITIPSLKTIAQPLNEHELAAIYKILESQETHRLRDIAIVRLLHCGFRPGSITCLNVDDYNGQQLRLRSARSNTDTWVSLPSETVQAIDAYLSERQQTWNDLGQQNVGNSERPLFVSTSAKQAFGEQRLSYHSIYKLVRRLGKLAEISHCYPERLKHRTHA
jgi:site-specific recombinase XerD